MSKDLRNQNIDERNLGYSYDSDFIENCDICACLDEVVNEEPTLSTIMMLYCKYQYETTGSLIL